MPLEIRPRVGHHWSRWYAMDLLYLFIFQRNRRQRDCIWSVYLYSSARTWVLTCSFFIKVFTLLWIDFHKLFFCWFSFSILGKFVEMSKKGCDDLVTSSQSNNAQSDELIGTLVVSVGNGQEGIKKISASSDKFCKDSEEVRRFFTVQYNYSETKILMLNRIP